MIRIGLIVLLAAAVFIGAGATLAAQSGPATPSWQRKGEVIWTEAPDGRIKARAYEGADVTAHPVLVVWLHGDLDPGSEHYETAELFANQNDDLVAAAVLRPGYSDAEGATSAGRRGRAIGDNYTARVADDVHAVIARLKTRFDPRAVILAGHSGGAGVAANLLGRHPQDADAALLIACSCDPREFMARWIREHPGIPRDLPNPSLAPRDGVTQVASTTVVRMVIGSNDTVVGVAPSQDYAAALERRGVDVRLTIVPGAGHVDVLGSNAVRQAIAEVIAAARAHRTTAE